MSRASKIGELVKEGLISVEAAVLLNSNPSLELQAGLPLAVYDNAGRPDANTVPAGTAIFNTDDGLPNYSDGAGWDVVLPSFPSFDDAGRPDPTTIPVGTPIFNTDDGFPNYSDGTNWVDHAGVTT